MVLLQQMQDNGGTDWWVVLGAALVGALAAIGGGVAAALVTARSEERRFGRERREANRVIVMDATREMIQAATGVMDAAFWTAVAQDLDDGVRNHPLLEAARRLNTARTLVTSLGLVDLDERAEELSTAVSATFHRALQQPRPTDDELSAFGPSIGAAKSAFGNKALELVGGVTIEE